nr:unnamed protein product [Spirometra erinaceieuropaei]
MGFPSPMLLQAALILLVVSHGIEKICREDNKYCRPLPFTNGDDSKDAQCRRVCAKKRANITEKTTAYFCKGSGQSCSEYKVYGRKGHGRIFERHVRCVRTCQMLEQLDGSSAPSFEVCDHRWGNCLQIERKDGSFNAYKQCVPRCSGWTDLERTEEHTAYMCDEPERREEQLNAIFPDIQFTMEEEENNQLAFLDVLVCRKDCGGLKTKVFRKATNTT